MWDKLKITVFNFTRRCNTRQVETHRKHNSGLNTGTGTLSGLNSGPGALTGLDWGSGALTGLDSESEALSGPDVSTTALLGLDVETGALSGLNSGTASIEATGETSGLGMASVAMTREAVSFRRVSMDKTRKDQLEFFLWTGQDL